MRGVQAVRRRLLVCAAFAGCFLGILALGERVGLAQSGEPGSRASEAPTVSLATLRVSARARAAYELARLAHRDRRDRECDRELAEALKSSPQFPEAFLLRAVRGIEQRRFEWALADANEAARLDPGLIWTPIVMAQAYNGTLRYRDAMRTLDALQGAASTSWQAKYERARAEVGLRHVEAAIYWSAQTLATAPAACPQAHLLYANALQLTGQWLEASRQMALYLASTPPSQPYRREVLAALAYTDRMAQEDAPQLLAAR